MPACGSDSARPARATARTIASAAARLASEILEVYDRVIAPDGQRLRVLHVHSGNLYGGVETFLTTLARDARRRPK